MGKRILLLLGNGFDLNCKLQSSFSDFLSPIVTRIRNVHLGHVPYFNENINIWYLIFYFVFYDEKYYEDDYYVLFNKLDKDNILWMDVEGIIKLIVCNNEDKENVIHNSEIKKHGFAKFLDKAYKDSFSHRESMNDRSQYGLLCVALRKKQEKPQFVFEPHKMLREELIRFENDFKDYLTKQVDSNEKYTTNSIGLMKELIGDNELMETISFNYTCPGGIAPANTTFKINHIHGNLDSNIIIGYDYNDFESDNESDISMSKAWQKMISNTSIERLPQKGTVDVIKIYGHSLGNQDYSYFHSLFDYYNVYKGEVIIEFCYTPYKDTEEENMLIRNRFVSSIFNLLNNYDQKSENDNGTKTLISRLQLENRLKISVIKKIL